MAKTIQKLYEENELEFEEEEEDVLPEPLQTPHVQPMVPQEQPRQEDPGQVDYVFERKSFVEKPQRALEDDLEPTESLSSTKIPFEVRFAQLQQELETLKKEEELKSKLVAQKLNQVSNFFVDHQVKKQQTW